MSLHCLLIIVFTLSHVIAAEEGPSPDETLCLEYINRLRTDPIIESERMLTGVEGGISGIYSKVDLEKCRMEIKQLKPAPPLAFNQQLIKSARAHAYCMIEHDMTSHDEEPGKNYFTGARPFERMRAAGYAGIPLMENAFLRAASPWISHCGFIIEAEMNHCIKKTTWSTVMYTQKLTPMSGLPISKKQCPYMQM